MKKPHPKKILPVHLFYEQRSLFYLFHGLLILLLIYPYVEIETEKHSPWLLTVTNTVLITAIIYTICMNRKQSFLATVIGSSIIGLATYSPIDYQLGISILSLILYGYAIILTISYLLCAEIVETQEIYGVMSIYILLGLAFAQIFLLVEWAHPGSFHHMEKGISDIVLTWSDFIFFSFTTLTTLGYGDISPVTSQARSLAIIEALTGVIFLATMVSRLIGLYISHSLLKKKEQ
jgi:hypothetical protein